MSEEKQEKYEYRWLTAKGPVPVGVVTKETGTVYVTLGDIPIAEFASTELFWGFLRGLLHTALPNPFEAPEEAEEVDPIEAVRREVKEAGHDEE